MKKLEGLVKGAQFGSLYGGPFRDAGGGGPNYGDVTIRLAQELDNMKSTIAIETADFKTPPNEQVVKYAMLVATQAIADGFDAYCGCMGGIGRTGTFMAVMVAALNPKAGDPIAFVRKHYNSHAVETEQQQAWVGMFIRRNQSFFKMLHSMVQPVQLTAKRRPFRDRSKKKKSALFDAVKMVVAK